jgi:7-cyano-7-deazaguanine synthase in queuosine biosynthesis
VLADQHPIFVRYEAGRVSLSGPLHQDVVITTQRMLHDLMEKASQRSIDLISIATGAYGIDRVVPRSTDIHNECGIRVLRIVFEVSDFEFWSQPTITELLTDILWHLTGDNCLVSFAQRSEPHRTTATQRLLKFEDLHPTRVALYSGGLDSAAGLANRLISSQETFMLLTIGHHPAIRSSSREQVALLRKLLRPQALYHASFVVRLKGGVAGKMKLQETTQRVRGFLFYATAAILADACSVQAIEVFENGVGAINLPLTEGGLVDGLSTRGAHPGILEKIGRLTELALEQPIRFSLPFIHSTKAEMLAPLTAKPHLADWLKGSRSCDHSSLRVANKRHCGHCAACIERRQAFRAAGILDDARDYDVDLFSGGVPKEPAYLLTYLENARFWTTYHPSVRSRLERHQILSDMPHLPLEPIEDLLIRHAKESLDTFGDIEIRNAA